MSRFTKSTSICRRIKGYGVHPDKCQRRSIRGRLDEQGGDNFQHQEESILSTDMGRKKDSFWEFAEELGGRFKCKFCGKDFAGGISRIKSHLSGIKARDIEICLKVPDIVSVDARQAINCGSSPSKKCKKTIASSTTLRCSGSRESKRKPVDEKFLKFQIANGFCKEDSRTVVEFVKVVSDFGPNYELPDWYLEEREEEREDISEYEGGVKELGE